MNVVLLITLPPGVVTAMVPVLAPAGTVKLTAASECTVKAVTFTPPTVIAVAWIRPAPVICTGSPTFPLAAEGMVSVLRIERPASAQGLYDRMELVQGLTALLLALHVPVESGRRIQDQGRRRFGRPWLNLGHA